MAEKRKYIKVKTPKGIAKFPYLNHPDTKFGLPGNYVTEIVLDRADVEDLLKQIEAEADEGFEAAQAKLKAALKEATGEKKAKAKKALEELKRVSPARPVYDDEGEVIEDKVSLKFTMRAEVTNKAGKTRKQRPAVVDAKGNPMPESVAIWGGSVIRVGGSLSQFHVKDGAGAKLYLEAVKVLELRTSGSGASAFGFDDEEEGYDASEHAHASTSTESQVEDTDATDDDDPDF